MRSDCGPISPVAATTRADGAGKGRFWKNKLLQFWGPICLRLGRFSNGEVSQNGVAVADSGL